MDYNKWKSELIKITSKETGIPEEEIKINDDEAKLWYNDGVPPYFVFRENWNMED